MVLTSLLLHPISLVISQVLLTALAISFTRPSSLIRPAGLPLVITAAWLIAAICLQRIPRMSLASIVAGNGPAYLLRYIDLVLLSKWSYETGGPTALLDPPRPKQERRGNAVVSSSSSSSDGRTKSGLPGTIFSRLRFGLNMTLSSRFTNTPWEVKNVPPFSASDRNYVPSRSAFLRHNAVVSLICYLVVDFFSLAGQSPESNAVTFASQRVPFFTRLGEIEGEQLAIRIIASLTLWLNIYCITRMGYSILAVVAVGTGFSREVSAWRPPFGRLAEAYTVRRFWG